MACNNMMNWRNRRDLRLGVPVLQTLEIQTNTGKIGVKTIRKQPFLRLRPVLVPIVVICRGIPHSHCRTDRSDDFAGTYSQLLGHTNLSMVVLKLARATCFSKSPRPPILRAQFLEAKRCGYPWSKSRKKIRVKSAPRCDLTTGRYYGVRDRPKYRLDRVKVNPEVTDQNWPGT